jgi:hypothetical protein
VAFVLFPASFHYHEKYQKVMTEPQRTLRMVYKTDMGRQMVECQLFGATLSKLPKDLFFRN